MRERWAYLRQIWEAAKAGWLGRVLGVLYGLAGFVSLIKSELSRDWSQRQFIDWMPNLTPGGWLLFALAVVLVVGFESAFKVHRQHARELARVHEWNNLPPIRGEVLEIVSQEKSKGLVGNMPYGLKVVVRPLSAIEPAELAGDAQRLTITVYVNDSEADIHFPTSLLGQAVGGSHDVLPGGAAVIRTMFRCKGLTPTDTITMTVSSMGKARVLRVEAG